MIIADWVAIGLAAFFALLGLLVGFGKGLRFFTTGFFGFLITLYICYCIGGFVIKIEFVQSLLDKLIVALTDKGTFCDILLAIHIEIIVFYVALFIIVLIIKFTVVKLIVAIFLIKNPVVGIFNRILGVGLFVGMLALLALTAFQIIYLIGGTTASGFGQMLEGSALKLDWIFENNPLMSIIKFLTIEIPVN